MANDLINKIVINSLDTNTKVLDVKPISGGCINQTLKINTNQGQFFLKYNNEHSDMFEKESNGIKLLSKCAKLKLPEVINYGIINSVGYLLLEFVEKEPETKEYWSNLGEGLASLHQNHSASQFGLESDNYIGSLPQSNKFNVNWVDFFISKRLLPQIELGRNKDLIDRDLGNKFQSLFRLLPDLFPEEKPSLLHGDLWSGNVFASSNQTPCIFDPAAYYGHREAELAFTMLFGGFSELFYDAYNHFFPLTNDFIERVDLYNLYPLLVHVNLFGAGYLSGIKTTLKKFT